MEFQLGGANAQTGAGVAINMKATFLQIPGSKNIYYSGTKLSETTGDTTNSVVSCKLKYRFLHTLGFNLFLLLQRPTLHSELT